MPSGPLNDFGSFWASGQAANQGLDPYAVYPETFRAPGVGVPHPNLNPPASLLLFAPMARLDPHMVVTALKWVGLLVFAAVVITTLRRRPTQDPLLVGAWAFALPFLWDSLRLGQVYVLIFAGVALVWHLLERDRELLAGVAIGCLAALKPNLLLWPALLFLVGERRIAVSALFAFAVLSVLPVLFFGPDIYGQWLGLLADDIGARLGYFANITVVAIGVRAGSQVLGVILALLVVGWAGVLLWRRRPDVLETSAIAVGVSILVSPVAWMHYFLLLIPALLRRRWTTPMVIGAAALVVPMAAPFWIFKILPQSYPEYETVIRATVGSWYAWGALLVVAALGHSLPGRNPTR